MPQGWKILLISVLCLRLAPCWGLEVLDSEEEEFVAMDNQVQISEDNEPVKKVEELLTEKADEMEKPAERVVERVVESLVETPVERPKYEAPFKSVEPQFLGSLGIIRLSKGINIFRFSHYVLKNRASLAKTHSLPQNSIQ